MKFGQYLVDNATPEWKRAYIDYRALKKQIKRVAARLQERPDRPDGDDGDSSNDEDHGPSARPRAASNVSRSPGRGTLSPSVRGRGASHGTTPKSPRSPGAISPKSSAGRQTPASALSKPSPNYGATGSSPKLTEGGPEPRAPPPLDLGGPALADQAGPSRAKLERRFNTARGVNFSPLVKAYPPDSEHDADDEDMPSSRDPRGPAEDMPKPDEPVNTIGDDSTPSTPKVVHKWRKHKKSSTAGKLGWSPPALSLLSPRVQPSVGVSQSETGDAPSGSRSLHSLRLPSPRLQPRSARSFEELYDSLESDEQAFFDLLDEQLDKVEKFYVTQETDATKQFSQLRDQLRDLAEHRRQFYEQYPEGLPDWEAAMGRMLGYSEIQRAVNKLHMRNPFTHDDGDGKPNGIGNGTGSDTAVSTSGRESGTASRAGGQNAEARDKIARQYDPERYQKYKKDLRLAMLEFYRHLELIKNYRILNLTGFRKSLKKFEKATKIICLELYTDDRIAGCTFARGETIDTLLKQTEELYTEHFEHGDIKRARAKLRQGDQPETHYLTVLRSGWMLGMGLPAMVLAIVKSFEPETRRILPEWGALLQIYGALYIPVIFGILFELNLSAWVTARINYEFVMELNRPILDFRSFLEIPAFLYLTLSYCFLFTFYRVSPNNVAPTTWPLAWLVFCVAFFLNPLPILRRRPRYWLLKVLYRVCTPGYSRVEFIAFFLADELNSLVYTIQNFYFMGCVYAAHWPPNPNAHCHSGASWPYALLAVLPPLSRLIQCVKRWYDSRLLIHLINAGKYCSSIISAVLFVYWRSQGNQLHSASFVVWVIFSAIASFYTSAWDLIVDWSLLRPGYSLLRPDLGYSNKTIYYFAMVTNVLIRFIWVWYLPKMRRLTRLRSFIFALLEMTRRWQWNFFRVETEHLGNADAYRVTREIPLPYANTREDSDDDLKRTKTRDSAKSKMTKSPIFKRFDRIRSAIVGGSGGRGPSALNLGPRGHQAQREYEARRPGDTYDARSRSGDSDSAV